MIAPDVRLASARLALSTTFRARAALPFSPWNAYAGAYGGVLVARTDDPAAPIPAAWTFLVRVNNARTDDANLCAIEQALRTVPLAPLAPTFVLDPIRWVPIRDRFSHGCKAVLGWRGVTILRHAPGRWHAYPERDDGAGAMRTVYCGASADYHRDRFQFRTMAGARRASAVYLRSGTWGVGSENLDALPVAK